MACTLCGGANHTVPGGAGTHALMNCPSYARVPQPLKDLIREVWTQNPQHVARGDAIAGWIYDNCYAQNQGLSPGWQFHMNGDPRGLVEERVYMSVHGAHVMTVWNALLPYFQRETVDVVQAKHCAALAANQRPDAIVVYLRNKAAVWRLLDEMRRLRKGNVLKDMHFKADVPPGTGRVSDLKGTATARQPANDASFGMELTDLIGEAFDNCNRPVRLPTAFDFMAKCLAHMKSKNVDIFKPWNRPRPVF